MPSTFRFIRQFLRPREGAVVREDTTYDRDSGSFPASIYRPSDPRGPLPGWVALHGLTYRGREHASLDRFARALAASGAAVLVPDVPEWRALRVRPGTTAETIRAAVRALDASGLPAPGRVGLIGFSFGGTQGLIASTDPRLRGHLAGVATWGGYRDLERTARFAFSGRHELDGKEYLREPDPYGRWILAGNYLTLLPEHESDGTLADAFLGLAREAGRTGVMSWDPATDPMKAAARERLDPGQREVFDLVAHPAGHELTEAERDRAEALGSRVARAALAAEPLLDPGPHLPGLSLPTFLAHGRGDRLIPWTEKVRLERALPRDRVRHAAVTGLASHSFGEKRFPTPAVAVEAVRFVRLVHAMIHLV
jgi:dienelactone hydrolase